MRTVGFSKATTFSNSWRVHLPAGPVYAVIDKASPSIQEGLRRGQPNIFLPLDRQGIDPFRQRFPVTLRYEGTVRGVGGLTIDRLARHQFRGSLPRGTPPLVRLWLAQRAGAAGPTRLGRSPPARRPAARRRRTPRRLGLNAASATGADGRRERPRSRDRDRRGAGGLLHFRRAGCDVSARTELHARRGGSAGFACAPRRRLSVLSRGAGAAAPTRAVGGANGKSPRCLRRRAGSAQARLSDARRGASIVGAISRC